jgi:hypothetical protein
MHGKTTIKTPAGILSECLQIIPLIRKLVIFTAQRQNQN